MTVGERTRVRSASLLRLLLWLRRGGHRELVLQGRGAPPAGSEPQRPARAAAQPRGCRSHSLVAAGASTQCAPCTAVHGGLTCTRSAQQVAVLSRCVQPPSHLHPPGPLYPHTPASASCWRAWGRQQPGLPSPLVSSPLGILWPAGLSQVTQSTLESLTSLNTSSVGHQQQNPAVVSLSPLLPSSPLSPSGTGSCPPQNPNVEILIPRAWEFPPSGAGSVKR